MIQSAYEFSETLGVPQERYPQDTSIFNILDDFKRREAFEFDLMELAGRVSRSRIPETELFYQICYEDIYEQISGGLESDEQLWLPYGDFVARLDHKETQEAYKGALEQALQVFKSGEIEFASARDALHRLATFWSQGEA